MNTALKTDWVAQFERQPQFEQDDELMAQVLKPYKAHCQYLQSVELDTERDGGDSAIYARCIFSIPESCYIDDTGHFNSVEFNICYNQMMYYAIAKAVKHQASELFSEWDLALFWQKQLPDILIVNFQSSFKRQLKAAKFYGEITFLKSRIKANVQYINTQCRFWDDNQGYCEGTVTLAITRAKELTCL